MNRTTADWLYVEAVGSTLGEVQGYFVACRFSILIKESKQYGGVTQQFVCSAEQMVYLGNLTVEVVLGAEVVVFSFGILVCANRRKLPILTTRKHQDKKKPYRTGNSLVQQGEKVVLSEFLIYIKYRFTYGGGKRWLIIWSAFVSCIFIMANQRFPRSFMLAPT